MAKRNISRRSFLKAAGAGILADTKNSKAHAAKTKLETAENKLLDDTLKTVRRIDLQEKVKKYSNAVMKRLGTKQKAFQRKEKEALEKGEKSELRDQLNKIVSMNQKQREKFLEEYMAKLRKATYLKTERMVVESVVALAFINQRMEKIGKSKEYPGKKQDLANIWNINELYTSMVKQGTIALFDKIGPSEEEIIFKNVIK